nr:MAG: replication associated protein [Cressdnaviricota sp.]
MEIKTKFRLNCQQIFITMPQTKIDTRERVVSALCGLLEAKGVKVLEYLCVRENHKADEEGDHGVHYHVYLELDKKINWSNPRCLDIEGEHGDYKGAKSKEGSIRYLLEGKAPRKKKEDCDPTPFMSCDWYEFLKNTKDHKKRTHNQAFLEQALNEGPRKMVEKGDLSLTNLSKITKEVALYKKMLDEEKNVELEDLPNKLENPWGFDLSIDLDRKKRHYWIWSRHVSTGKTTWIHGLEETYRVQEWDQEQKFQDHLKKDNELLYLDAFRGGLTMRNLEQMCDGGMLVPVRQMAAWKLNKTTVIILGNKPPEEVYKEDYQEVINIRFNVLEIINAPFHD